jgi:hypothetical protein
LASESFCLPSNLNLNKPAATCILQMQGAGRHACMSP